MTRKLARVLTLLVRLAPFSFVCAAWGGTLTLTLDNSSQTAEPGGSSEILSFFGSISAPAANSAALFVNGSGCSAPGPLICDTTPLDNALVDPANILFGALAPGESADHILLFTVTLPASTSAGVYEGGFGIFGGESLSAKDVTANVSFSVTVPEPASMLLLLGGAAVALAGRARKNGKQRGIPAGPFRTARQ